MTEGNPMKKKGIFVLDVGTSKVHANIIDLKNGKLLYNDAVSYPWLQPDEKRTEILSEKIWEAAQSVCEKILEKSADTELAGLSFSWFGAELVTMDLNGDEVFPLIVSFDSRAEEESMELKALIPPERDALVGRGGLTAESNPAKILWLKKNHPDEFKRVRYIGNIAQYFYKKLGLPFCTERSMSQTLQYWEPDGSLMRDIVTASQVPEQMLDYPIVEGDGILGELDCFGRVTLPKKIPVLYGGHDCILSQLGSGVLPAGNEFLGDVSGTYDLMGFFRMKDQMETVDSICCNTPMTNVYSFMYGAPTGAELSGLVSRLWGKCDGAMLTELFSRAHFDGEHGNLWQLPEWEQLKTDPASLSVYGELKVFESIVEEITFGLRKSYQYLCEKNGGSFLAVRVGGGASRSKSWLQLKADVFGTVFEQPDNAEISSMGAAIIAAVVLGEYPDYETAIAHMVHVSESYRPGKQDIYDALFHLWENGTGRKNGHA